MKKNFVKYFGVASTTLLAVAPVATPALMTASNLAVVKASVQDDISASFKTDNSLVQLTADQWQGLTSTIVNRTADSTKSTPAPQSYLNVLKTKAEEARKDTAKLVGNYVTNNYTSARGDALKTGTAVPLATIPQSINIPYVGDGKVAGSIKNVKNAKFSDFYTNFRNANNVDNGETAISYQNIFGDLVDGDSYTNSKIAEIVKNYIENLPLWWFISTSDTQLSPKVDEDAIFNAKSKVFKAKTGAVEPVNNGLVTVAPNGGVIPGKDADVDPDYQMDNPDLAYVGDNLVDLQKATNNELLNLIPSVNQGQNKSGTKFSNVQGQFKVPGGVITASNRVSDGSKVWSTILQSVLNPKNAMYPLKDLTTSNIVKTKMLVNGKDADKNQFITKDEIQNADRISIQFIFKDNSSNEYKSPTIWLTHGNKFTVNTSGLGNITRLPGDYYQPSAGITGIINDTGLPMDTKKFVVIPAGTDLAYYTDKDGIVNLSDLAALQSGILGTNGVAINRGYTTAFEGGKLGASEYWTDPNYIYSKFGSYSDSVDVYYIEGTPTTDSSSKSGVITKDKATYQAEAASAVQALLKKEIVNNADLGNDTKIPTKNIIDSVNKVLSSYVTSGASYDISDKPVNLGITGPSDKTVSEIFSNGDITKKHFVASSAYPDVITVASPQASTTLITSTGLDLFNRIVNSLPLSDFKEDTGTVTTPVTKVTIPLYQLTKVVANAGRTTKVDVPSKYLPQVAFNAYDSGATYYANGSTIDNWFNYDWSNSGSASNSANDPYYPAGGVIVTGGSSASSSASSSAANKPASYLAPASFAANSISADQFKARVNDNIQKFMAAKLTNPNTQSDSKVNGYFKSYQGKVSGDAAYAYIKNGAVPASDLKVDTSKVDVTKPGTYYVEVTYAPLSTIKSNTFDGSLGATNGNVAITDANGYTFNQGLLTDTKFVKFSDAGATAPTTTNVSGASSSLTTFAADQIFANGAPATYKLKVQITDGSNVPESGAPVIAFTEGGQNLKIAKGGTFDQFKGLQFYAYPGAKAWDQKDDSVKVSVSGKVNTNVEGTYTLVYTVTNKAGKTSTLTRVITVGSGVEKPTEYDFNLSEAYIDYVPGYNVREYSYPGNDWTGNQVKHGTDVKVTKRAVFQNGEEWYKLGDGNWVKSQYVKAGKNPSDAVDARGVVTVNYIPGYGIAVYKEAGKPELVRVNGKAKRLPHGTAWKSFKKQKVNGITYYNVGGNQWVDGRYVDFK